MLDSLLEKHSTRSRQNEFDDWKALQKKRQATRAAFLGNLLYANFILVLGWGIILLGLFLLIQVFFRLQHQLY